MKKEEEFFIGEDNSGHLYIIPMGKKKAWQKWCDLDEECEDSWNPPEYAEAIGGHISAVKFKNWRIDFRD